MSKMQLKTSCILTVPFQTYDADFSFIVNGEEFKTSRFISDLLSPTICKMHLNDPTVDTYIINTKEKGDFSLILQLVNFNEISFPDKDVPFISEVIEILGNNSISYESNTELTVDNVFTYIAKDEKNSFFFHQRFLNEIEFISSHFNELCEEHEEEFQSLSIDTLYDILNNHQLRLKSEDQLLNFINNLYTKNSSYSILYETVYFENVLTKSIKEFISFYDINDITGSTWNRLSNRLSIEIKNNGQLHQKGKKSRYIASPNAIQTFIYSKENEFNGIINYLKTKSNDDDDIKSFINISSSSSSNILSSPYNTISYNENKNFMTTNVSNSWIRFDFKKHRVILTDYTVMSGNAAANTTKPKNWVIEASNDGNDWIIVDEQNDCPHLNGPNFVHSFKMNHQNDQAFRFVRMKLTGLNWGNSECLSLTKIEFFGNLKLTQT